MRRPSTIDVYPAKLINDDGHAMVVFPNISNCFAEGDMLTEALELAEDALCSRLFSNCTDGDLTRSGVRYRLDCLLKKASVTSPSLTKKNVTPHTFRHTTALRMLQSGVDISTIAIWLGHESIITTHKYMEADLEMKRQTLEKMGDPGDSAYHFTPDDSIMAFLDSL